MSKHTIRIAAKGEEVVYMEEDKVYHFEIFLERKPLQLLAGRYWTGSVPVVFYELTESEKLEIVPRLVDHLGANGNKVEVVWQE